MVDRQSRGVLFHKVAVPRLLDQPGDAVHRPVQRLLLPPVAIRRSVLHLGHAVRVGHQLKSVGALWTEAALVNRALWIALDVNDLSRLREDKEAAADRAIRAHTLGHLCSAQTRLRRRRAGTKRLLLGHGFGSLYDSNRVTLL